MSTIEKFQNYRRASDPLSVAAIFEAKVSIVEYRSELFSRARNEGLEMADWSGKTFKCVLDVNDSVDNQLREFLDGYPAARAALNHQIELLRDITGCRQVGLRFAVLSAPMCPAMHTDKVLVRFVWTVCGESTEFLAKGHDRCHGRFSEPIRGQTGSLIILKGTRWSINEQDAAWHRSPPVNDVRVVFTLDSL